MLHPKPLCDPLGNTISIPLTLIKGNHDKLSDIKHVITSPAFIIKVGSEKLYFFRLINWDINMLVEVHCDKKGLIVYHYIENPTVDFISALLDKGALISFQ